MSPPPPTTPHTRYMTDRFNSIRFDPQGWRVEMEDAHTVIETIGESVGASVVRIP
jgi:hypothetical protein